MPVTTTNLKVTRDTLAVLAECSYNPLERVALMWVLAKVEYELSLRVKESTSIDPFGVFINTLDMEETE